MTITEIKSPENSIIVNVINNLIVYTAESVCYIWNLTKLNEQEMPLNKVFHTILILGGSVAEWLGLRT